jgi:hypothetical protein
MLTQSLLLSIDKRALVEHNENVASKPRGLKVRKAKMKPVDTILQVGAFYKATGFSFIYTPLLADGEPVRKTLYYIRDFDGNVVDAIFAEVLR